MEPPRRSSSTTSSAKHRQFINEPMANKPVTDVPGIGQVVGRNMCADGVRTARALYGYYLDNPRGFRDFVMTYGANAGQQEAAFKAMSEFEQLHD